MLGASRGTASSQSGRPPRLHSVPGGTEERPLLAVGQGAGSAADGFDVGGHGGMTLPFAGKARPLSPSGGSLAGAFVTCPDR